MMQVLSTNGVIPPRPETLPQALVASDLEQVETIFTQFPFSLSLAIWLIARTSSPLPRQTARAPLLLLVAKACGTVKPAHHTLGAVVSR